MTTERERLFNMERRRRRRRKSDDDVSLLSSEVFLKESFSPQKKNSKLDAFKTLNNRS